MSGGDLIALAERCERATGADIQLDADIRDALSLPSDYSAEWRGWGFDEAGDPIEKPKAFPYTASLDDAMSLVPEGAEVLCGLRQTMDTMPWARVGPWHRRDAVGATLALALCAAALRARATFPAASQPVPQAEAQQPTRVEAVAGDEGIQP